MHSVGYEVVGIQQLKVIVKTEFVELVAETASLQFHSSRTVVSLINQPIDDLTVQLYERRDTRSSHCPRKVGHRGLSYASIGPTLSSLKNSIKFLNEALLHEDHNI